MVDNKMIKHLQTFPHLDRQLEVGLVCEGEHAGFKAGGVEKNGVREVVCRMLILQWISKYEGKAVHLREVLPAESRRDVAVFEEGKSEAAEGAES